MLSDAGFKVPTKKKTTTTTTTTATTGSASAGRSTAGLASSSAQGHAAPAQAQAGAVDLSMALDQEDFHGHLMRTHRDICSHLYQKGFLSGMLSDITVRCFHHSYHLHRLLLVRSPFFEKSLLPSQQPPPPPNSNSTMDSCPTGPSAIFLTPAVVVPPPPHTAIAAAAAAAAGSMPLPTSAIVVDLHLEDGRITPDALSICFAYLYGAPIYSYIKTTNVHAVLACAYWFELAELCELCAEFIVKTLHEENILASVDFVTAAVTPTSSATITTTAYGKYTDQIRLGCLQMLCAELPKTLGAFFDEEGSQQLAQVFQQLPFSWLKEIVEDNLVVPSEFEKYTFAKRVIEQRKQSRSSSGKPPMTNETVVLLFDRDTKGRVSLTEHTAKKPYVKHHHSAIRTSSSSSNIPAANGHGTVRR